jgi:CubicO group peptidase (beta-lactamase class C family)
MDMRLKQFVLLVVLSLALRPMVVAQDRAGAATELSQRVDQLFSKYDKKDSPGCAVGVIRDGRLVYKRGYGMANLDFNVPNSPVTVFNVASMSKQFTAASIILLAQQRKISFDDDIRKYIPEIPDYGTPITIRQLAYHTSGLRDYTDLIELSADRIENIHTDQDILRMLARQKRLNFKPGERHLYSNSGYVLLGLIVERVTGKTLRAFENEFIFQPLGMTNTLVYDDRTMVVKNRASGYVAKDDGSYQMRASLWDRVGDGGVLTTVEDLFLWDQNFYNPKVGNLELINLMTTPGTLTSGEKIAYTFGLEPTRYKGLPVIMHGGSIRGFRAQMYRFPEQKFSVICLCNNGSISPTSIIEKVADIYLADHFKSSDTARKESPRDPPKTIQLSENELARFAGVFATPSGEFARRLYVKTGKLWYYEGENEYELAPLGENRFIMLGVPEKIEVVVSPSRMVLTIDDGRSIVYEAVKPALEQLAEYTGRYYSEELDTDYTLTVQGNKLVARKKIGDDLILAPQFADVFGDSNSLISARFMRDPNGRVTGFVLNTSRMKGLTFKKL